MHGAIEMAVTNGKDADKDKEENGAEDRGVLERQQFSQQWAHVSSHTVGYFLCQNLSFVTFAKDILWNTSMISSYFFSNKLSLR